MTIHIALTHCYKLESFFNTIFAVFLQTASRYYSHASLSVYGLLVVLGLNLGLYHHVLNFCCPSKASRSEKAIFVIIFIFLLPVCQFFIRNIFLSVTSSIAIATGLN